MDKETQLGPPWSVAVTALINLETIERAGIVGRNALESELESLHNAMDRDYATFKDQNEEGDYLAHVNDEYIEVSETIPCLFWYSQFLIGYSSFEVTLNAICKSYQKENESNVSLKDIAGQGIVRAQKYLVKMCNRESAFSMPEWGTAKLYGEIRNGIAHRSGFIDRIPNDPQSLFSRVEAQGIELKIELYGQQDAQIILTEKIVIDAIAIYKAIILELVGLDKNYITPKHGTPSESSHGHSW